LSKRFFFEKKNQKTSGRWVMGVGGADARKSKNFCALFLKSATLRW
jgi:hypothetical protein